MLTKDGKIWAWGRAEGGQLGLEFEKFEKNKDDDVCVSSPAQITG